MNINVERNRAFCLYRLSDCLHYLHNLEESGISITYLKMVISHSHECLGQATITENNANAQIIAVIAVEVLEIF